MNSVCIMLLPDDTYKAARPDVKHHHLTLGHLGKVQDYDVRTIVRLRNSMDSLAFRQAPIAAKANGTGLFNCGEDGHALVDLIDGAGVGRKRLEVERMYGHRSFDSVHIDESHGFTPHMTAGFLGRGAMTKDVNILNLDFTFVAIGLWAGDHRYEVGFA